MPDREKVKKGLHQHCEGSLFDRCGECPYYETDYDSWEETKFSCRDELLKDALALLEEQEDEIAKFCGEVARLTAMLKEQEAVTIKKTKEHGFGVYGGICPKCRNWIQSAHSFCGFCGQAVKWE